MNTPLVDFTTIKSASYHPRHMTKDPNHPLISEETVLSSFSEADRGLLQACEIGEIESARGWLSLGANPNVRIPYNPQHEGHYSGYCPLTFALNHQAVELTQLLLSQGAWPQGYAPSDFLSHQPPEDLPFHHPASILLQKQFSGGQSFIQQILPHFWQAFKTGSTVDTHTLNFFKILGFDANSLGRLGMEYFAKHQCKIDSRDQRGLSILDEAAKAKTTDSLKFLLFEMRMDPNSLSPEGYSAATHAIVHQRMNCLELLIQAGADLQVRCAKGGSLIDYAKANIHPILARKVENAVHAQASSKQLIALKKEQGELVNAMDEATFFSAPYPTSSRVPLFTTVSVASSLNLEPLLEPLDEAIKPRAVMAPLLIKNDSHLDAQLLRACRDGDADRVKELLAEGASPYASDLLGVSALLQAIEVDRLDILKLLLNAGAKAETPKDCLFFPHVLSSFDRGMTLCMEREPTRYAISRNRLGIAQYLVDHYPDSVLEHPEEYSALMRAKTPEAVDICLSSTSTTPLRALLMNYSSRSSFLSLINDPTSQDLIGHKTKHLLQMAPSFHDAGIDGQILHIMAEAGAVELAFNWASRLAQEGVDFNAPSAYGPSILAYARQQQWDEGIKRLTAIDEAFLEQKSLSALLMPPHNNSIDSPSLSNPVVTKRRL